MSQFPMVGSAGSENNNNANKRPASSLDASWAAPEWRQLLELEARYLQTLGEFDEFNKVMGSFHERTDKFERRASADNRRMSQNREAKLRTNLALATAVAAAASAAHGKHFGDRALALVLDGEDGATSKALVSQGFRPERVLVPNTVPSVAAALRDQGLRAWAGRVEGFLEPGACPALKPLDLLYLDHTGSLPKRAGQIRAAFQSLIPLHLPAVTAPQPAAVSGRGLPCEGWSRAHAVYALFAVLLQSAVGCGLWIEGAGIEGLADYTINVGDSLAEESKAGLAEALAAWEGAVGREAGGALAGLAVQVPQVPWQTQMCYYVFLGRCAGAAQDCIQDAEVASTSILAGQRGVDTSCQADPAPSVCEASNVAGAVPAAVAVAQEPLAARADDFAVAKDAPAVPSGESATRVEVAGRRDDISINLRQCLYLYPEQMMFAMVQVCHRPPG
ncbi:unnamed protein product [Polarella glacialis]|uniref:Uncharacterized protein n=1 Tax=Polarella glacialis TaxID=89957 RepID=A0A813FRV9_POLGL|nr:unnamed protein product [Polarella glacialis]